MKIQFFAFSSFLFLLPAAVGAQMFNRPAKTVVQPKVQTIETVKAPAPAPVSQKITAQDIIKQVNAEQEAAEAAPITMTPEQKAAVKKPLVEQIINDVDKADIRERKELIRIMQDFQEIQTRRQNLNLPEDEQIKIEDPHVNAASKEDVQKYLQEKLVAPVDRVMNVQ